MIGIYKITNTKNDKAYIGQSVDIDKRVKTHKRNINKIDIDTKFYRALRKYKWDNFSVEVLEECEIVDLDEREKYWIKYYDSYENGYNSTEGGDFNPSHYPELVKKRTEILLNNPEVNKKLSLKGEENPRALLTTEDVKEIRRDYKNGVSFAESYQKFQNKVSKSAFQHCWLGKTWSEIMPEVFDFRRKNNGGSSRTREEICELRLKYMLGATKEELIEEFNLTRANLNRILNLTRWKYPESIPEGYKEFITQ